MPKYKKKERRIPDSRQASDDEYDAADNASTTSGASDAISIGISPEGISDEVDEIAIQEAFEEKVKDVIEGLSSKSSKARIENAKSFKSVLTKKYMYEFLVDRRLTVSDVLERCIKKGNGEEQSLAIECFVILCIHLGASDDSEELFRHLKPLMITILNDASCSTKARCSCAEAVGFLTFMMCDDNEEAHEVLVTLENIFKASYLKGDGSVPNLSVDITSLHNSALQSWCLLLSVSPSSTFFSFIDRHINKLPELLDSKDVELRISAGEAIALLYDLAREVDEQFEGDDIDMLISKLKDLATDSNKYRAKKDRKQQRSSFRDILKGVEEGDFSSLKITVSGYEKININSWAKKRQYDFLCSYLNTGMNTHLQQNDFVRDVFNLGPPIPLTDFTMPKSSKAERHLSNVRASKARTKTRGKVRDKRNVASHLAGY